MIFKIKHFWNKIRWYLSFLLFAFYLIIGFLLLFSDTWSSILIKGREIVGIALILYSILRFYIAYKRYKRKHKHLKIQFIKKKKQLIKESQNVTNE